MKEDIETTMTRLREVLAGPVKELNDLRSPNRGIEVTNPKADIGEIKANLTLAMRHLEDARMRLGKAIQAHDGGASCYSR